MLARSAVGSAGHQHLGQLQGILDFDGAQVRTFICEDCGFVSNFSMDPKKNYRKERSLDDFDEK